MTMNIRAGIPSWVLLVLLALTSAILCITPPSLGGELGTLYYVGGVYGTSLAVYFVACRGVRSALKLIILVLASAVAWPIAYISSFDAARFIPGAIVHPGEPGFPLIAFSGVLGGAVLLLSVLLFLKSSSVSWGAAFGKAFLGILLSGIVGGIAWELGPTLGAAIWALLPGGPFPDPDSYSMAALFFVWQPVMALFIGWASSGGRKYVLTQASGPQSEVGAPTPQTNDGVSRRVFVVIVASLMALSLTRIIPVRLRLAHRERAVAKMRASRPSTVDLPITQPMSEEEALILRQIGNYQPGHAMKRVEMVSHEKGFERAGSMYFSTLYTKTGEPIPQAPLAPRQYISVVVQQYPNSAWAQYFAEYPPNRYNSFDNPKQHAIVAQFNNRVRSNRLERSPGQTWYSLYYIWPSGDCVITVEHNTPDENLEIEQAYLEKYPSSIP
jgi:hypothetical protein